MLFVDSPGPGNLVNLTSCKHASFTFETDLAENEFTKTLASLCSLKVFIFLDFVWKMLKVKMYFGWKIFGGPIGPLKLIIFIKVVARHVFLVAPGHR